MELVNIQHTKAAAAAKEKGEGVGGGGAGRREAAGQGRMEGRKGRKTWKEQEKDLITFAALKRSTTASITFLFHHLFSSRAFTFPSAFMRYHFLLFLLLRVLLPPLIHPLPHHLYLLTPPFFYS